MNEHVIALGFDVTSYSKNRIGVANEVLKTAAEFSESQLIFLTLKVKERPFFPMPHIEV